MYLARDSFCVSFKWVVIVSIKQEDAHTQSAKVSTCYTLWHFWDWSLITGKGGGGYKSLKGGPQQVLPCLAGGGGGGKFRTRDVPIL